MSPVANSAVRDRLRIAIQKSGRLSEPARALLASSGLSWRESRDKLFCYGESLPVDLLLVRDDDIPGLIAQLRHAEPWVRGEAASVLGIIGTPAALAPLPALLDDPSPQVQEIVRDIVGE